MSVPRAVSSIASSAPAFSRLVCVAPLSFARRCPQCFRPFSSYNPYWQSSRRQLQTASAYHPSTLDPPPPPPRNAGVPDTSIAGGIPKLNETRPPRLTGQHGNGMDTESERAASVSVPEGEAQKSKPVASASPATAPTQPSARPKRTKFRSRKAAVHLTPGAVSQLRELLDQPEPKLIRVGVKNRGCSGLAYHLEYVDKPGAFDETVEQDGVKVLIDSKALFSIIGSEMDWVEDKLSARFVFKNPNISKYLLPLGKHRSDMSTAEQCGCGESFSIS